jgi:hypothetical protein
MAEQVTILELNGGIAVSDPTNARYYVVIDGVDYFIEQETIFKNIYRSGSFASTGLANQIITYSTPFLNVKPLIFDPTGVGYDLVSWDENGFVITTYGIADLGFITIKDR